MYVCMDCTYVRTYVRMYVRLRECVCMYVNWLNTSTYTQYICIYQYKHAYRLAVLMQATDQDTWRESSVKKRREKYGFFAGWRQIHGRVTYYSYLNNKNVQDTSHISVERIRACTCATLQKFYVFCFIFVSFAEEQNCVRGFVCVYTYTYICMFIHVQW